MEAVVESCYARTYGFRVCCVLCVCVCMCVCVRVHACTCRPESYREDISTAEQVPEGELSFLY